MAAAFQACDTSALQVPVRNLDTYQKVGVLWVFLEEFVSLSMGSFRFGIVSLGFRKFFPIQGHVVEMRPPARPMFYSERMMGRIAMVVPMRSCSLRDSVRCGWANAAILRSQ